MLVKVAALTLLPMLMVGGAVLNSSIMLVTVHNEHVNLSIPVPLALAQVALAFAPDELKHIDVPAMAEYILYLEDIVTALQEAPDAVFVELDDGSDHVRVYKEGDLLKVTVREGADVQVTVQIPFASMMAVVHAYDKEGKFFRTSRLVGALRAAPSGDLVHVIDGDEEVRIRMW